MQGDIGGFGAGSDFSWHLFPVVGAILSKKFTLAFGYRALGMNYTNGSSDRQFKYNVITHGVVIGGVFHL